MANALDPASDLPFPSPEDFTRQWRAKRIGVVFGSRSNHAFSWVVGEANLDDMVRGEFGTTGGIMGNDDRRFGLRDPSALSGEDYAAGTDYGVIARVTNSRFGAVFVPAGFGGRAPEGGGLYLFQRWRGLQSQFGEKDFAVVLHFDPPVYPNRSTAIAWYRRAGPCDNT